MQPLVAPNLVVYLAPKYLPNGTQDEHQIVSFMQPYF